MRVVLGGAMIRQPDTAKHVVEAADDGQGAAATRESLQLDEAPPLWLALPFAAALLPGASPSLRQQAAMSMNIPLKVRF